MRSLRVGAWCGLLVAAISVLLVAGRGALGAPSLLAPDTWAAWAAQRDAITIAFALLRMVTLATAWYLLGVTVVAVVAQSAHSARLLAAADLLTAPAARRMVQTVLGAGLATASLTVGAAPAAVHAVPPAVAAATLSAGHDVAETVPPVEEGAVIEPIALPPPPPGAPVDTDVTRTWTVQPGHHFWSIAEQALTEAWQRPPTEDETAVYWRRLIARNKDALVDPGNPDLVHPGQRFTLPEIPRG